MLSQLLNRLRKGSNTITKRSVARAAFRRSLFVESLEERRLLAINVIGSGDSYAQVEGDSGNNTIVVSRGLGNPDSVVVSEGINQLTFTVASPSFTIYVYGRNGDDTIRVDETNGSFASYSTGPNTTSPSINAYFVGEAGSDTLIGGSGSDFLNGGEGRDSYDGGAGYDQLQENLQEESSSASASLVLTNSQLAVTVGVVTQTGSVASIEEANLSGNNADNTLDASAFSGYVNLFGYDGNDVLKASNGGSYLVGGAGNDSYYGGNGSDTLQENLQEESSSASASLFLSNSQLAITVGATTQTGSVASIERAILWGSNADNTMNASAFSGYVSLYGYDGNDVLLAGSGGGQLYGMKGNDTLIGGSGSDYLYGAAGSDSYDGGAGSDQLQENLQEESTSASASLVLTNSQITVTVGTTTQTGSVANVEVANLSGDNGDNTLDASAFSGYVYLYGNAGNDVLRAGNGGSYLNGGAGNDSYFGGAGYDQLQENLREESMFVSASLVLTNSQLAVTVGNTTQTGSVASIEFADLYGNNADNTLDASAFSGRFNLSGIDGNDVLKAGSGGGNLYGGAGINSGLITATGGNDVITVSSSDVTVNNTYPTYSRYHDLSTLTIDAGDGVDRAFVIGSIPNTQLTFLNLEPYVQLDGYASIAEGSTFFRTGSISDPSSTSWTATVDYGDGPQPLTLSADNTFSLSRAYADNGTYNITVRVTNNNGATGTSQVAVNVFNVAPVLSVAGADRSDEGSLYSLTLGAVVDPGQDSVAQYIVRWGDGTIDEYSPAEIPQNRVLSHVYADGTITRSISVVLVDEDGEHTGGTKSVVVDNVSPSLTITGHDSVNEGSAYVLTLGQVVDPGQDTVTQYTIHWGDGQTEVVNAIDLPADRKVSHIYADGPANRSITIDLLDEDSIGSEYALDSRFGNAGKVTTDFPRASDDFGYSVAADPTTGGSVVFAAVSNGYLFVRYQADGSLDTNFGNGGRVAFDNVVNANSSIAIDSVGRILVAGYSSGSNGYDMAVARYLSDGSLDVSFGSSGKALVDFTNSNGQEFGNGMTVDGQDRILITGYVYDYSNTNNSYDIGLARLDATGSLDSSFGIGGKVTTNFAAGSFEEGRSVAVDPVSGNILVFGSANGSLSFVRYDGSGNLDTSFGNAGRVAFDNAINWSGGGGSLAVDSQGNLLVAGTLYGTAGVDFVVARYTSEGVLDSNFGSSGKVLVDFGSTYEEGQGVGLDGHGKICLVGYVYNYANGTNYDIGLTRLNSTGGLDTSFDGDGRVTTDLTALVGAQAGDDYGYSVAADPTTGGSVVFASTSNGYQFVRYQADGSLDTNFGNGGSVAFDNIINANSSIAIDSVGRILVAGNFYGSNGPDMAVARYLSDGSLDVSFGSGGTALVDFTNSNGDEYAFGMTVDSQNRILIVGRIYDYANTNNYYDIGLARLDATGSLDSSFGTGGKVTSNFAVGSYDEGRSVAVDPVSGNILVFGYANGSYSFVRYDGSGNLDTSFGNAGRVAFDNAINWSGGGGSLAVDSQGNLLVAGSLYRTAGADIAVARYTSAGVLDSNFGSSGKVLVDFGSTYDYDFGQGVGLDGQGNIYLVGYFYNYANGTGFDIGLARLSVSAAVPYVTVASLEITVENVAPTATIGNSGPVNEASPVTVSLNNGSDASNADATSLRYYFSTDALDRNTATYASSAVVNSASFTFNDDGSYTVYARVVDKDGGTSDYETVITVSNVNPAPSIVSVSTIRVEGTQIDVVSSATDPAGANDTLTYGYAVYKDNSATAFASGSGVNQTNFSYTPNDNGSFRIVLTVGDEDGGSTSVESTITVDNIAPTATISASELITYGAAATIAIANQLDPSTVDTLAGFRYAYATSASGLSSVTYATANASVSQTFSGLAAGSHTLFARIIDKDDGFTEYSTIVTVDKAPLTVSGDAKSKIYGAAEPVLTFTPSGTLYYGDSYSVISGVVLSSSIGATATAGTHVISTNGGSASNYVITHVDGTLSVDKAAALTATADNKSKVYGAADPVLTYTPSGTLYYGDAYSVISGISLATVTGAAATAGTHPIDASGGTASNYEVTSIDGTLSVDKAATLTTIAIVGAPFTYTGAAQTPATVSVTGAGGLNLTPTATYVNNINAGTATASYSYAGDDNYLSSSDSEEFTIGKTATLTTVTIVGAPFTYTGAAQTPATVSVTGAGGLNLTPTATYVNNINAGTATASYSYAGDDNYLGSSYSEDFTIGKAATLTTVTIVGAPFTYTGAAQTPATVTVTGAGGLSLNPTATYVNNINAGTATASYSYAGDDNYLSSSDSEDFLIGKAATVTTVTIVGTPFTYTGSSQTPATVSVTGAGGLNLTPTATYANNTNAGNATASYSFAGDANYFASSDSEDFTIGKSPTLTTITIVGAPFTYTGAAQTPATVSVTGAGGLSLTPTANYVNNINAGTATANYSYAGDANYFASSDSEDFTIGKAPTLTTITIVGAPFTYTGSARTPATVSVTGAGGLSLTPSASYVNNINAGTTTASYSFAGNVNYFASSDSEDFTIGKAAVTITANNKSKTYGAVNPTLDAAITGTVNGDVLAYSLSTLATQFSNVASYGIVVTLGTNSNYSVTSTDGTLSIGQKAATVSANNKSKTYGAMNPTLAAAITGTVNGDVLAYSLSTPATQFSNVASYGITVTLGTNPNYSVTSTDGTLTIGKKSAIVSANNKSKTYGAVNPALDAAITGTVNGDVLAYSLSTPATQFSNVASYGIVVTLGMNPNYSVTSTNGTLTIGQKSATVSANNKSKTYGAVNPTLDAAITGTVNGDVLAYSLSTPATQFSNVGNYPISVSLGTNINYSISFTNSTLQISTAGTNTSLSSSAPVAVPGLAVTFTATVTSATIGTLPTGTVVFRDGTTVLASVSLVSGVARFTTDALSLGNHAISVTYSGDSHFAAPATVSILQQVKQAALVSDPLNPGQLVLYVGGTAFDDEIEIKRQGTNLYEVEIETEGPGNSESKWDATFNGPISRIVVFGLAGDDEVEIEDSVLVPALIDGGAGNDEIKAGGGNSVLLGGSGNDELKGGKGRDMLIGGIGEDELQGKDGDDILIGGVTNFDVNEAALVAVLKEWSRTDASYQQRVANLSNASAGGVNPNGSYAAGYFLTASTVKSDGSENKLKGGSGMDWYFANLDGVGNNGRKDKITGKSSNEIVTNVRLL